MRFLLTLIFSLILVYSATKANADAQLNAPQYYEIVDLLTTELHTPQLEQWLKEQSLTNEQALVVEAIKSYKAEELQQGVDSLSGILANTQLPEAHYWAGRLFGQQASEASMFKAGGLAESALLHFKRSVELDPHFLDGHIALVQYYIRAPFFAGGSVKKARLSADDIAKLNPIEGILAHIQIAGSEEDNKALTRYTKDLTVALNREVENSNSEYDNSQIANYFFSAAMTQLQAEEFALSGENLRQALDFSEQSAAQFTALSESEKKSILSTVKHSNLVNLQQAIRYQIGRLGVVSEQNIDVSIIALNDFLAGPKHPTFESHWAKLRLAQLLQMDGQLAKAKDFVKQLPDIDNDQFKKLKKKLLKKL